MDVFRIGTGAPTPSENGKSARATAPRPEGASNAHGSAPASYASSTEASGVTRFVAQLAESSDVRSELVDRFRALYSLGELDTPAAYERAASGMING